VARGPGREARQEEVRTQEGERRTVESRKRERRRRRRRMGHTCDAW
jgi:hypothetical protein